MDLVELLAIAVVSGWLALGWLRLKKRGAAERAMELGADLAIVHTLAAKLALERGGEAITPADFVRAALEDPRIAASFERAGVSLEAARSRLSLSPSVEGDAPDVEVPPVAKEAVVREGVPVLAPELSEAFALARSRSRESDLDVPEVLAALGEVDGVVPTWLRALGVAFDDTLVATSTAAERDRDEAYVYLWNDGVSPMPSVVALLRTVFAQREHEATYTMLAVHHRGSAALGPYTAARAAELVAEARRRATELGIPRLVIALEAPDTSEWRMGEMGLLP